MRRLRFATVAVLLGLGLPAAALAARSVLHGPAATGTVDITLLTSKGKLTKLKRFEFNNIPATCTGNRTTAVSGVFPRNVKLRRGGRFSVTGHFPTGRASRTVSVSGRFTSATKGSGTIRIHGPVPGCLSADTGRVHWTAKLRH
jgi:hypothetical protein